MDIHSPTQHVFCSVFLMRIRKRPVQGGNSGLVRSTMPQEADRSSVEMCQRRPSGTGTTKNTRYKNKPGPAWQGICRHRKYPNEGESVRGRWGKTLILQCLLFGWWQIQQRFCTVGVNKASSVGEVLRSFSKEKIAILQYKKNTQFNLVAGADVGLVIEGVKELYLKNHFIQYLISLYSIQNII